MPSLTLSLDQTAEHLGRSKRTIYRLIDRGEITPVRYGGRQSIPVAQVNALAGVK